MNTPTSPSPAMPSTPTATPHSASVPSSTSTEGSTSIGTSSPTETVPSPSKDVGSIPAPIPIVPTIATDADAPDTRGMGGLLALVDGAERALPLRSVRVRAHITGDVCRTEVHQVFANPFPADSGTLLEAVHIFPLPVDGAVTELRLAAGDVTVRAECRSREEAEKVFAQARDKGHQAGLLTAERADVHTLRVTNLPPGEEIRVEIVVLERLQTRDGERRWRFPTVIAPRYLPGEPIGHDGPGVLPNTASAPDASRLQPPLRLAGGTPLDLEVTVDGPVRAVASSLHAVRVTMADGNVRVAPSSSATLDRDFVLGIEGDSISSGAAAPSHRSLEAGDDSAEAATAAAADTHSIEHTAGAEAEISARAWTDGSHTLLYVEPPRHIDAPSLPRDAVFVLDRSGSMSGRKMDAARLALRTALRGLAPGDRFQLLAFDNRLEAFGDGFHDYTDNSVSAAEAWLASIDARGGTEMLPAMHTALAGETPAGRLRTVLLITDGQVWNQTDLLRSVSKAQPTTLVFTMGIDTAVNEELLQRLARLGGGTCELLTPHDDIEAAVARLEARFGSPVATGVRIAGGALEAARWRDGTLFAGAPLSVLLAGAPANAQSPTDSGAAAADDGLHSRRDASCGSITVRVDTPNGPRDIVADCRRLRFPIGPLWARERVAALEDRWALDPEARQRTEAEIRDVALRHGIASRFTAFVAVIESTSRAGTRVEIVQPAELPAGWDESFRGGTIRASGIAEAGTVLRAALPTMGEQRLYSAPPVDAYSADVAKRAPRARSAPVPSPATTRSHRDSEQPTSPQSTPDVAGDLARTQRADGSWNGDVEETVAALRSLIALGHTRRKGLRRRVVAKAARWLSAHIGGAGGVDDAKHAGLVREALRALAEAEGGAG